MKKVVLCLIAITSIFLSGCGFDKLSSYEEISFAKHKEMRQNKETFVLFIGSATCSACNSYKETLKEVIKKNQVKIYYIDLNGLSETEKAEFDTYYTIDYTPTTVFIDKGEEQKTYNRLVGAKTYEEIITKLKSNGYIKDDKQ